MKSKPRKSRPARPDAPARTVLRAFRFDVDTLKDFEDECDGNLRNPRMVLEALMHHWLRADARERVAIAERFRRHAGKRAKNEK